VCVCVFVYVCNRGQRLKPRHSMNTSFSAPKELKEKEEYVDHIHVEADGSKHMLLWVQRVPSVANQQLHVKRQELKHNKRKIIRFCMKHINMTILHNQRGTLVLTRVKTRAPNPA